MANVSRECRKLLRSYKCFTDKALVNGTWIASSSNKYFPVYNPSTGEEIASVPDLDVCDVKTAIDSASKAFSSWRFELPSKRSHLLRKLYESVMENSDDLAFIMTAECGKPIAESKGEIVYAASFLEWFAEEAKRIDGDYLSNTNNNSLRFIIKQPVGPCTLITPWNFPLAMITRKMGAAIAAGCSTVIKPSEETPLSALAFAKLAEGIGFPPGLINVVTCSRDNVISVGEELATNDAIHKVSFTGSTEAGKWLLAKAAKSVKNVSMELGGSAPFIVFNSADVDVAVDCLIKSKFRNSGQTCICPDRIFVQDGIHDQFVSALTVAMKQLSTGDPFDVSSNVSCLINEKAVKKMEIQQRDALSQNAVNVLGGKRHPIGELFYEPTLLINCNESMRIMKEETFGPLIPVMRFQCEEEVIAAANNTNTGLAGYFFSNDHNQIWRVARQLDIGMIGANESAISSDAIPFGGMKESGLGREGSKYGIDEYFELKYLCIGQMK